MQQKARTAPCQKQPRGTKGHHIDHKTQTMTSVVRGSTQRDMWLRTASKQRERENEEKKGQHHHKKRHRWIVPCHTMVSGPPTNQSRT